MRYESENAVFIYQKQDEGIIFQLAQHLDKNVSKVWDFFEIEPPEEKVVITILPTKEEFDNYVKLEGKWKEDELVPNFFRGYAVNGKIFLLSIYGFKNTVHAFEAKNFEKVFEYYKKTLVHEYVHCVNEIFNRKNNCSYTEKFLIEGIAVFLSGQRDGDRIPFDFTYDEILDKTNYNYGAYYLLTKYFVENYDKAIVLDIFQSSRQAREFLKEELFHKAKKYYNGKTINDSGKTI